MLPSAHLPPHALNRLEAGVVDLCIVNPEPTTATRFSSCSTLPVVPDGENRQHLPEKLSADLEHR